MKKLISILSIISCSACSSSQYVLIDKNYDLRKEIVDGSKSRVLYLYTTKLGADAINANTPGVLIATKNCAYNEKNEGEVLFEPVGMINQSSPGVYVVQSGVSNKYRMKFVLSKGFEEWRMSGPLCVYYHASRAFGSPEVFSNMLRFK